MLQVGDKVVFHFANYGGTRQAEVTRVYSVKKNQLVDLRATRSTKEKAATGTEYWHAQAVQIKTEGDKSPEAYCVPVTKAKSTK